jgi:speckle-type POZ protein
MQESSTNEYDLSDCSVDNVQWLIDFLYMGTYQMEYSKNPTLTDHIAMFALGDMYDIEPLALYAAEQFRIVIAAIDTFEEILPLIPQVYGSTPEHRKELR